MASPQRLSLEADTWEKAGEPFLCDWCAQRVEILDSYWSALFFVRDETHEEWIIMRVCANCAMAGPPLETVMPQ